MPPPKAGVPSQAPHPSAWDPTSREESEKSSSNGQGRRPDHSRPRQNKTKGSSSRGNAVERKPKQPMSDHGSDWHSVGTADFGAKSYAKPSEHGPADNYQQRVAQSFAAEAAAAVSSTGYDDVEPEPTNEVAPSEADPPSDEPASFDAAALHVN